MSSLRVIIVAIVCLSGAQAQVYEKVFSFTDANAAGQSRNLNNGSDVRAGLVQGNDGNFYGTTNNGGAGAGGTVFKMTPDGTLTTLVQFGTTGDTHDGLNPDANLVQGGNGNFFGTTTSGGANAKGTVFTMTPGGVLTTLVEFAGNEATNKGNYPRAGLMLGIDGNFYGTTVKGGANDHGTVFKMTPAGVLTTLVEFTGTDGNNKGSYPWAGLVQGGDGNIYGTTTYGGTNDHGTVFKMTPTGVLTTLVEFADTNGPYKGCYPIARLTQGIDGNCYGTTYSGGVNDLGTVFKMTPDGSFTTLVEFSGMNGLDMGGLPYAGLIQGSDGNFYGTTNKGGTNDLGTVFKMTPAGDVTTLVNFSGNGISNKGRIPRSGLVQGSNGSFYGTTQFGGANDYGTLFKLTPGEGLVTFIEFSGSGTSNKGIWPNALVEGSDGNLYGTTFKGGENGCGTAFKMTPAGVLTTLAVFTRSGSCYPESGLVLGSDGNFYGTTDYGGASDKGTVFKMTPGGVLTTLVEFTGTAGSSKGRLPYASMVQGSDGNFYGTTEYGGVNDLGTVFKMTSDGSLTTLVEFTGNGGSNKGSHPFAGLVQGSAGNFYGASKNGGVNDLGTVFKMTPEGTLTTLVEFTGTGGLYKGSAPYGRLVQGSDGSYFGTTYSGGAGNFGTVFKMTPNGSFTTLVELTATNGLYKGSYPYGGLVQGSDGNFYGTTSRGGTNDYGTVFKMTPDGVLTTILDLGFDSVDSFMREGGMFASDGNFYGSATRTNESSHGSVFRLVYPGVPGVFPFETDVQGETAAVLKAKVNARGATTTTVIEYGTDGVNFPNTLPGIPGTLNGFQSNLVGNTLNGLSAGGTYYYRFRATSSAGTTVSPVISFATLTQATAMPTPATHVQQTSARFNGTVNAHNYGCTVAFQYGIDGNSFPYAVSAAPVLVTGATDTAVSAAVAGFTKGTTYYYRIAATNAGGTTVTGAISFNTLTEPTATAGGVVPLSTTSAQVSGTLNAQGSLTQIIFEYGTGGADFSYSVAAMPATASGTGDTPVTAVLTNLVQGNTYHFRVKGTSAGGIGTSTSTAFQMATLSGLTQVFPGAVPDAQGYVFVTLLPSGIASGWRFVGEQQWRASGVPAGGKATGDRLIEFRPVPGYIQPPQETVGVVSGEAATFLERTYYFQASTTGDGGLTVTLKPESLAAVAVPENIRAQWRLLGEDDTKWRDTGADLTSLPPGNYLIECKPVTGRTTPPPTSVFVLNGQTAAPTVTYFLADSLTGTQPGLVPFETVTTDQSKPYAYVGQIRSDAGSSSGFVVKPRVVATAGHVVFDDGTLSAVTGLQWLFQRHRGTYEPKPQIPRGFYSFDGYAAQRTSENTPGSSSPQSQNLDTAALYFSDDAGRGGYGGFLASDLDNNEFILSSAQKMLVGYPVDGISASNQGRMHATPPANAVFAKAFGHTYTTASIRSSGGGSGGPLCIQYQNGAWYPAAIYLGGSGQTVVRSIDSQIIELFNRAEVSGNGGDNNTGGGITHTSVSGTLDSVQPGSLMVLIEPAAARTAGAAWRLKPETSYRASGAQKSGLSPGSYVLELTPVAGFPAPIQPGVIVTGGQLTTVSFTYGQTGTALETWRLAKFGTISNSGDAADSADPDHDGQSNLSEYAAGTNPNDAADVFKVLTSARTASTFTLTASGKAGRTYSLQRKTDLSAGTWTTVATLNPLVTDGPVTLTDPAASAGKAFYRIQVSSP